VKINADIKISFDQRQFPYVAFDAQGLTGS
jgi:hypothetical protein